MADEKALQEMQLLEQSLQNTLLQKQAFQMELTENQNALNELKNSGDEVFKIVGQLMIKSDKKKMQEEIENREKIFELRIKTLEKQETSITEQLEQLREKILKKEKK